MNVRLGDKFTIRRAILSHSTSANWSGGVEAGLTLIRDIPGSLVGHHIAIESCASRAENFLRSARAYSRGNFVSADPSSTMHLPEAIHFQTNWRFYLDLWIYANFRNQRQVFPASKSGTHAFDVGSPRFQGW